MSSFERAVQDKLKDKEGLHKMMLAKVRCREQYLSMSMLKRCWWCGQLGSYFSL